MGLPKSFDFLKNVEIVLRESVGDATASYVVRHRDEDWGDLIYDNAVFGAGPWVLEAAEDAWFTGPMLHDIAEALEALNALENGGRHE